MTATITLDRAPLGTPLLLTSTHPDATVARRLASLGLRRGARLSLVQRLAAPQRQCRGAFAAGEHVREEYLIQQEYEHHFEVQRQKRQQVLRRVEAVPAECEHQRLRGEEYAHENDEIRDTHNNACTQSLCPDKSEIGAV